MVLRSNDAWASLREVHGAKSKLRILLDPGDVRAVTALLIRGNNTAYGQYFWLSDRALTDGDIWLNVDFWNRRNLQTDAAAHGTSFDLRVAFVSFAVIAEGLNEPQGLINFTGEASETPDSPAEADIAIFIDEALSGQGIGTDSAQTGIHAIVKATTSNCFRWNVFPKNAASIGLATKLGFKFLRTTREATTGQDVSLYRYCVAK